MVVICCYLESENHKVLKSIKNKASYCEKLKITVKFFKILKLAKLDKRRSAYWRKYVIKQKINGKLCQMFS